MQVPMERAQSSNPGCQIEPGFTAICSGVVVQPGEARRICTALSRAAAIASICDCWHLQLRHL